MSIPSNPIEFPYPAPETLGVYNQNPGDNADEFAKLIRPRGAKSEVPVATVAREALRLIDRTTGKAYSADELKPAPVEPLDPLTLYVRPNGVNATAKIGRTDLPFKTMQAAYDAVVAANFPTNSVTYDMGDFSPNTEMINISRHNDTFRIKGKGIGRSLVRLSAVGLDGIMGTWGRFEITASAIATFDPFEINIMTNGGPISLSIGPVGSEATAIIPIPSTAQEIADILISTGILPNGLTATLTGSNSIYFSGNAPPAWMVVHPGVDDTGSTGGYNIAGVFGSDFTASIYTTGGNATFENGTGGAAGTVAMIRGALSADVYCLGGVGAYDQYGSYGDATADGIVLTSFQGNNLTTSRCYLLAAYVSFGFHAQLGGDTIIY